MAECQPFGRFDDGHQKTLSEKYFGGRKLNNQMLGVGFRCPTQPTQLHIVRLRIVAEASVKALFKPDGVHRPFLSTPSGLTEMSVCGWSLHPAFLPRPVISGRSRS